MPSNSISSENGDNSIRAARRSDIERSKSKRLKNLEKNVKTKTDEVKLSSNKLSALNSLANKVQAVQDSLKSLSVKLSGDGAFSQKAAAITTTDTGDGNDYLDVTVGTDAAMQNINVSVTSVATAASAILKIGTDPSGMVPENYLFTVEPNGYITINLTNANGALGYNVPIAANDDLTTVVKTINQVLADERIEASLIKNSGTGLCAISLKALDKGEFTIDLDAGSMSGNFPSYTQINGTDAEISVQGFTFKSSSNVFTDVLRGITIEAKKINTVSQTQTITTTYNKGEIAKGMQKFIDAFNDYQKFYATQHDTSKNKDGDDDDKNKDTAYLRSSQGLMNTQALMDKINSTFSTGVGLKNLASIGLTTKDVPATDDSPAYVELDADNSIFIKAIISDIDSVEKLFANTSTSVADGANLGSFVQQMQSSKYLQNSVLNTPIRLSIAVDAAGVITPTASINGGAAINGTYDSNTKLISFSSTGSFSNPLDGLVLEFSDKGLGVALNGRTEIHTLNITQGIADTIYTDLSSLTSPTGQGSIDREIISEREKLEGSVDPALKALGMNGLKGAKEQAKDKLKKLQEQIDEILNKLELADKHSKLFDMQMEMLYGSGG